LQFLVGRLNLAERKRLYPGELHGRHLRAMMSNVMHTKGIGKVSVWQEVVSGDAACSAAAFMDSWEREPTFAPLAEGGAHSLRDVVDNRAKGGFVCRFDVQKTAVGDHVWFRLQRFRRHLLTDPPFSRSLRRYCP
jgi:hypothetical protein